MKKKKKKNKLVAKYRSANAKGNLANSGLKAGVDLASGAVLGAVVGAASGRAALPVGLLLMLGAHYFNDETALIRVAGASAIAYSIGKSIKNKNLAAAAAVDGFDLKSEAEKAKTRLSQLKEELKESFFLNKFLNKSDAKAAEAAIAGLQLGDFNDADLDSLDSAFQATMSQIAQNHLEDEWEEDDQWEAQNIEGSPEYNYSSLDDNPDLTHI